MSRMARMMPTAVLGHIGRAVAGLRGRALRDDIFTLAASIAYAAILSVFPLLLVLVAVLGRFVEHAHAQQTVVRALAPYLPPSALAMVEETLVAVAPRAGTAGAVALIGLVWSATALASAARHGLNRVLGAQRERPLWHRKLVELSMVLVAGAFLSVSVLASAAAATSALRPLATAVHSLFSTPLAAAAEWAGSVLSSWLAFVAVYRFLPNARVERRLLLLGSVSAVVLFEATKSGFFWYVGTLASYPVVYGPLVGAVVFMIWIYLVALVLLIGAEVMVMGQQQTTRAPSTVARSS